MAFHAVLAGCGSYGSAGGSKALDQDAILRRARSRSSAWSISIVAAAEKLPRKFGLDVPDAAPISMRCSPRAKPDLLFDVVVPNGAARRGGHGALAWLPRADRKADGGVARRSARHGARSPRDAERIHAVVQNRRYIPGVRRIRRMIETGALGELTALHADFFIGAHFGGFRDAMQNVLLLDMAIHTLRRGPLHGRRAMRVRSTATKAIRTARGTRMAPPPTRSSSSVDDVDLHLSRLVGGRGRQYQLGEQLAYCRHARHAAVGRRRRASRRMWSTATRAS